MCVLNKQYLNPVYKDTLQHSMDSQNVGFGVREK